MSHGPVMFSLQGVELTAEEREMLDHPAAGGIILFSRNFVSAEQVADLSRQIREGRTPAPLIAVDQEGGRVQRFRQGFTELPPAAVYGHIYQSSREHAKQVARDAGWLMAAELRAVGVDFSFAPVLDVERGVSQVIGDRAFGSQAREVADLALAWAAGARESGMPSVGKHFPGHGAVTADSHLELPVDERPFEEIEAIDLYPFRRLIDNGLEAVMPAHVIYSQVDQRPAGFSSVWIRHILRERMGFSGVVFSDDLNMAAAQVAGSFPERGVAALEAGCDMVLACNNPQGIAATLDALGDHHDPVSRSRIARMHGKRQQAFGLLHENPRWHETVKALSRLDETDPALALDL